MKRHFYAIPPPPYGQNTFLGREMERRQKGGKNIKQRWMTGGRKWRRERHQRGEVSLEAERR